MTESSKEHKFDIRGDLVTEFNPTTKFDRNDAMVSGVTFSPVGDLCVADSANGKIKLFDVNGALKVECTVPKKKGSNMRPHGLALMSKGNIIASDKSDQNLKIFTPYGRLYCTVELHCGNLGKLCTFADDKVAVIDEENRNIIIVSNKTNEIISTLSKDQSEKPLFKVPYDVISVKIDDESKLLVSDIRQKKLIFVDPSKKESKISDISIEEPCGLTKLQTGSVLVADKSANKIVQLSGPSLAESKTLLGPEHGLESPIMVAGSSRGWLAVVEDDRSCIKLYR